MAKDGAVTADHFFYSQPGLSREQVIADFEECAELAGQVQPPRNEDYVYAPTIAGAATVGFLQGMQRGEQRRNLFNAAHRKCMAIKGYKRFAMTKDEAKALYAGSWEERRERMASKALEPAGDHQRLDP